MPGFIERMHEISCFNRTLRKCYEPKPSNFLTIFPKFTLWNSDVANFDRKNKVKYLNRPMMAACREQYK